MDISNIFTETSNSDNRTKVLSQPSIDEITVGSSCKEIFTIPLIYSHVAEGLNVIYKQGVNVILTLTENDVEIQESTETGYTTITVELSPAQTTLFKVSCLDTRVQVKFFNLDGTITYTDTQDIKVIESLDH